jgi:hypothetical protein
MFTRVLSATIMAALLLNTTAHAGDNLTLLQKAKLFEYDMDARFVYGGQLPPKLRVPTAERPFRAYNMPDNAYMTGMYLGMLSMQYAATKDPAVREKVATTLDAMNLICTVSGVKGLAVRAYMPVDMPWEDDGVWRISKDGKYRWRGDVSNDQMDGILYGYWLAYDLASNDAEKVLIRQNVGDMVRYIFTNGRRIIGFDGKPTEWGSYYKDYVYNSENMNALIALQHLKVAHYITRDPEFDKIYRAVAVDDGYADVAVTARGARPHTRINYSDDMLLSLAYYPLLKLEQEEPFRSKYRKSYKRSWNGVDGHPGFAQQLNAYFNVMAADLIGDTSRIAEGIESLRVFPLDMKMNHDTIAAYAEKFEFTFSPEPESQKAAEGKAVPLDRREKQWSVWVHTPYREGIRNKDHGMEYQALDYLMAYWFARWKEHIGPEQ